MTSSPEQRTGPTDVGDDEEASASGATRPIHPEERRPSLSEPSFDSGVAPLLAGEPIGRYLVLEDLARGGMSIVYVAYDPKLDRRVALKVMRPDATERPQRAQARLLREAQAMAQLAHPNVVRVYDVGVLGERVYMAMELVEGQTLRDWISSRARGWREIVGVLRQVGRGLAAAHAVGLVHLDVKPHNILVGHDGEVRVVDFGLARTPQEAGERSPSGREIALPLYDEVTHAGMVMGTPGYMAPEQLDEARRTGAVEDGVACGGRPVCAGPGGAGDHLDQVFGGWVDAACSGSGSGVATPCREVCGDDVPHARGAECVDDGESDGPETEHDGHGGRRRLGDGDCVDADGERLDERAALGWQLGRYREDGRPPPCVRDVQALGEAAREAVGDAADERHLAE